MALSVLATVTPDQVGYVLVFAVAALACFASAWRARLIDGDDTRRGLVALLVTSGGWALAHAAFFAVPVPELREPLYQAGLIVGFASVGPWLYFCSAFTGRTLHRRRRVRQLAVGLFLAVVLVKLTNPIHGLYYSAEYVTSPFPHLAVENHVLHWLVMGLSYVLAGVGLFMLLELFWQVGQRTTSIAVLVGVTGLPVILDVAAYELPGLVEITHEPLGVAVFAVGVLFFYFDDLQSLQFAAESDSPVIVLDDADRIRDYNSEAREVFPDVETGERIDAVAPEVARYLDEEEEAVIRIQRKGGLRYYQVSSNPFSTSRRNVGRALTLTDITEREQYRTELERQNERLDEFASMVSHDLRNPLNVAMGRLDVALEDDEGAGTEHLQSARRALDRMEALIDDLLTLARQGQPVDEFEAVSLATVVRNCWAVVETKAATLDVGGDLELMADERRLQQLLENLVRNAVEHGGEDVTISVGPLATDSGFYVADDGPGVPPADRETVFESGFTTDEDGTGFGLAIVREIVEAHGWMIEVVESDAGGARFEISDVEVVDTDIEAVDTEVEAVDTEVEAVDTEVEAVDTEAGDDETAQDSESPAS